jgi:hypothetical protein
MAGEVALNDSRSARRAPPLRAAVEAFLGPPVAGLVLLVTLIGLIASALHDPRPHDIPVGLTGPTAMRHQLSQRFGEAAPGAFKFTDYDSEAAARAAIDSREIDAALIIGPGGATLVVAGAAGDAVTGAVTGALGNAIRSQGQPLRVETVHPFASGDAHGLILFFLVVAVIVSTLVAQAVILVRAAALGIGGRLAVLIVYAALAGLVGTATAAFVVGGYGDRFWEVVGLASLAALAVGAPVAGGARLLGAAGFAVMALIMVLFDLISSGGPIGPSLLPDFYRHFGPWMPASLTYSALRGDLYFDRAGVAMPVLVLLLWALAGLALVLLSEAVRSRRQLAVPPR